MSLRRLQLPVTIDTSSANMADDFYVPALSVSVRHDQGVGFFFQVGYSLSSIHCLHSQLLRLHHKEITSLFDT